MDVVRPTISVIDDKPWFFIRYWQAGPHLRVRVADLDPAQLASVERAMRERLDVVGTLAADEQPLDGDAYARSAGRLAAAGEGGQQLNVEDVLPPGVYRRAYLPEIDRYGGEAVMPATERLFQLSSELVVTFLPHMPTTRVRSIMTMRATVAAASALTDGADRGNHERAAFYAHGIEFWRSSLAGLGYSPAQLDHICRVPGTTTGGVPAEPEPTEPKPAVPPPGPLDPWSAAMTDLVERIRYESASTPGQIVFSHVHMLHNRLGLSLSEELQTYVRAAHLQAGRLDGIAEKRAGDTSPTSG
jgi:thiopeptide-type bacteriocin biosynthesis protein